jgi:hypothetical protein
VGEARDAKIRAAVYATFGALWLALTGACTWTFASDGENFRGFWVMGLWFMSAGILPLAIGLQSFLSRRVLGWALCVLGTAWLGLGLKLLADLVLDAIKNGVGNGALLAAATLMWLVFLAPGVAMLWCGVATLKAKPRGGAAE